MIKKSEHKWSSEKYLLPSQKQGGGTPWLPTSQRDTEAHSIGFSRAAQDYVKSSWPNSLASLSSALSLRDFGWILSFLGRGYDLIHLSQAYQPSYSAASAGGWVIIFTSSYPWALRAQSLAYSSSWITAQSTFNHVLNQLNWKSCSEKLPGANFHVLY